MKNKTIKILYLEHEPNHVERLKLELDKGQYEYKLTHADSGSSFETEIDKAIPDVVLFDNNIPDYDIYMAMEALKGHDIDAPCILVTSGLADEKAVDMIVNYGVSDYILKDNLSRLNPAILREYKNKQVYKQLNEHKKDLEKLSLVASHTHNGVIITDKQGRIEWVNHAFTTITGYTLEESIGKIPGHFLQGEDTSEETVSRIRKKLTEEISFSEEILNYHKKGYPYWIKIDISPVKDDDGNVIEFIAIQEDITDRKKAEFGIIKAKERAEKSESDLKKALSEKEVLIQEIHHRVKNNLAIISGLIELQIIRGDTHPQLLEFKNRILSIASVHEQLYSTDNFSEIDVEKYFNKLIINSKKSFMGPDQEIDFDFKSSIDKLSINEAVPLGLMTSELMTNSVKHAFPNNKGSITITMNSAHNGMIEYSYADSGKGFEKAKFENDESFGLEMINILLSQLTEDFTLKTDDEFSLTFQFKRIIKGAHSNL